MNNVATVVLAGGRGSRLAPLTEDHAKPAVPFGGNYRIIDFTLSNCINSGLRKIFVLTQFKSMSLDRHINQTWRHLVNWPLGEFVEVVPAQQRLGERWYLGNADAVYQNIYAIEKTNPDYVVVLAGDHIYKMDYRELIETHIQSGAQATVAALPVRTEVAAGRFGVLQVDTDSKIVGFEEKPDLPEPLPGSPSHCLASMGVYVFSADFLFDQLCRSALREGTEHDFGRDIIAQSVRDHHVSAFVFVDRSTGEAGYWRDVGTIDSLYDANMDLLRSNSPIDIYDEDWPVWHTRCTLAPPRIVLDQNLTSHSRHNGATPDSARELGSLISPGSHVYGHVRNSILGSRCKVAPEASVVDSILFESVEIQRGAQVRNAIITEGIVIPPGCQIGFNANDDAKRGATFTENGRVIISHHIDPEPLTRFMNGQASSHHELDPGNRNRTRNGSAR